MNFEISDLVTILFLIFLEGVLSADNAVLLAVLAMRVPQDERGKALRYGLVGAFIFRIACLVFASALIKNPFIALLGGSYLLYLPIKHFLHKTDGHTAPPAPRTFLGLSLFWSTVITIELTDIVFAIDSILVAVGMSNKLYVVITGALLGLVAMRFVAGGFLKLIERFPTIVDGAYVIVAWVGIKLLIEYAHKVHWIGWEVPRAVSVALIFVIFGISLLLSRKSEMKRDAAVEQTAKILESGAAPEQEIPATIQGKS